MSASHRTFIRSSRLTQKNRGRFASKMARRLTSLATRHCAAMRGFFGLGKQSRQKLRDQLVANVRGEE
jgi:hypothetical protein